MDRKKKKQNGGMYLAICCCAVVVAIVGYANRMSLKEEEQPQKNRLSEAAPPLEQVSQRVVIEETQKPSSTPEAQKNKDTKPAVTPSVKPAEIKFTAPVSGKVIEEFSGDDLVYNEALKDWRTHSGVDFEASLGEKVTVSASGVVESVFDSSLGRCVIIDHKNGYRTMYANLNEDTPVKEGDEFKEGDTVGSVGDTALGDISTVPHLHFEIMKNDVNINPIELLE